MEPPAFERFRKARASKRQRAAIAVHVRHAFHFKKGVEERREGALLAGNLALMIGRHKDHLHFAREFARLDWCMPSALSSLALALCEASWNDQFSRPMQMRYRGQALAISKRALALALARKESIRYAQVILRRIVRSRFRAVKVRAH